MIILMILYIITLRVVSGKVVMIAIVNYDNTNDSIYIIKMIVVSGNSSDDSDRKLW